MKQIWKCDFCEAFGKEEEIAIHEEKCVFNPKNKACWSCKNWDDELESWYFECEKHGQTFNSKENCQDWAPRKNENN